MNKIIKTIILTLIGGGCFSVGVYYGVKESGEHFDRVMDEYEVISKQVDSFTKVSDPETIRHYVKELNKMLDDLEFLNNIIQSGQIADNSLDLFIDKHQKRIDDINGRILSLHSEHMELVFKFKEQVDRLTVETDDNLELIQGLQEKIQEQNDYVNKLNVELNQSIKELEDDINKIKNSTYWLRDKKIWSK